MRKAKELRGVLSRMKIVDDAISIEANNQGMLNVSLPFPLMITSRSSNVTVFMETTFSSVQAVDTDTNTVISAHMRVDIKSLMKALSSIQVEPKAVHFCQSCTGDITNRL